ncbi:MAG: lipoyl(octanoyl) transferase [Proteobacteria bacterium]|nr:MAG: lipoyl(octanoyl) transferase [Pseudomonadota bacterium]
MSAASVSSVEFIRLQENGGPLVSFERAWILQKQMVEEVSDGRRPSTIFFVEHPPVVTRGRGLQWTGLARDRARPIASLPSGTDYFEIERGGDLTWHGPGQFVVYPILDLKNEAFPFARDVGKYVRFLERWISTVLRHYQIESHALENAAGVWLGSGTQARKIASLGIAIKKWVSYHGLALNVSPELTGFKGFDPCGFESSVMTSIERETKSTPALEKLESQFEQAFRHLVSFSGATDEPSSVQRVEVSELISSRI